MEISTVAINIQSETLLSLADASRALPLIDGKRPHVSTLWRWSKKGLHGVHLEHVRIGHRVCTSIEALSRFVNALGSANSRQSDTLTLAAGGPGVERANEVLTKNGV